MAFEAADGALVPHKATFQELSAQLDTSRKRATEAEKELSTQTAALHITPQTLPEKIKDTLFYDKVTWTLECSVSATVYFAPGWKTDLKRKQRLESKQSTTDTAQKGHSMAQVTDDPKMYPKSKDEIVAGLNVDAHKQLARATDAFIAEYFTKTASAALAQEADTDSATHTLLTLLSGAPTRLDDSTQKAAIDYVLKSQELHDFSLLDPTYSASPAEAKVAGSEPEPQAKQ